ncbi:peptidylprolyl isomerase [Chelativorans sp. ZYF759]|uniref:peptidylprolyl isomerase n=1 Tax=Chelativorans sp. ZYF759 TaxID=2692213 RepID=UPI00145D7615|nr:peptidylprolyl isomerase [Chelativorans sp. ZYF759]NMG41166.1 peptidylprolyl isomerase [Chelativorans sp. ZYF759]
MLQLLRQYLPVRLVTVAAVAMLLAGPALAQDDAVVATLNGEPITEADLAMAEAELDQQFAQLPEGQRRAAAMTAIVEIRLMSQRAEAEGLGESAEFQSRMELLRQRALHAAYIENNIAAEVTDEALRARYDQEISGLELAEEVRARHIIVETEEEAAALIGELDEGGDFEELAREHSQDGAAQRGGDLGYFSQGQMVPEFEEVVFDMEVDAYTSEPVQTQFGWHVIQLVDRRQQEAPAYEAVEQQLRSLVLRERYFQLVQELREEAEIEFEDDALRQAYEGIGAVEQPQAE